MGQRRSVWVLIGQQSNMQFMPKIRGVYFSKRDANRRIQWLKRGTADRFNYWLEKVPFFEDSGREDDSSTHADLGLLHQKR